MEKISPVLSVRDLSVAFGGGDFVSRPFPFIKKVVKPLPSVQVTDHVSFDIFPGEFFSLVGESGCGKSVTAMGILRLLPWPSAKIVNGSVVFEGESRVRLDDLPLAEMQKVRGSEISCIFQEPMQALNPVLTIKNQLMEVFKFAASRNAALQNIDALEEIRTQLKMAGFAEPGRVLDSYPHELSGGMLQRVCIVMALLSRPKLIIADEPTTALDVTVQAQVLEVLKDMTEKMGTAVLLITHNMGIVSQYARRVAVMYAGRIVECGPVREVINRPMHPYTQGLLAAIPESHSSMRTLHSIPGTVPHPKDFVAGCRFADRCSRCSAECKKETLPPKIAEADHFAYCYNAKPTVFAK